MNVLEAIDFIVTRRKEQHRYPYVALFYEISELVAIKPEDLKIELNRLFKAKTIDYYKTINQLAFYRYEDEQSTSSD